MIDQIILTSCEHQRWRRAGAIAVMNYFGYTTDMIEVIWGLHADEIAMEKIVESFNEMGMDHNVESVAKRFRKDPYGYSNFELKTRTLHYIRETGKRSIILEDDYYLVMPYGVLNSKLKNLCKMAGPVHLINLWPRGTIKNDVPHFPIVGAEDFMRGCNKNGHCMLYVTPEGADAMLESLKEIHKTKPYLPTEFVLRQDNMCRLPSVFSAVLGDQAGNPFGWKCNSLDGDSIGLRLTQSNISERRSPKQIATALDTIERFRL